MPDLPKNRQIESYINDQTLKDLLISHWLMNGFVGGKEEVLDLDVSPPNEQGVRTLKYTIGPELQTINH